MSTDTGAMRAVGMLHRLAGAVGRALRDLKLGAGTQAAVLAAPGFLRGLTAMVARAGDGGALDAAAGVWVRAYAMACVDSGPAAERPRRKPAWAHDAALDDLAWFYVHEQGGETALARAGLGPGWASVAYPAELLAAVRGELAARLAADAAAAASRATVAPCRPPRAAGGLASAPVAVGAGSEDLKLAAARLLVSMGGGGVRAL
ncbi:MAG: hypothetical protein FJ290_00850 [Planctomycetes bacterium]|nr:hypothetical protein [Planctomycetota bacterium]